MNGILCKVNRNVNLSKTNAIFYGLSRKSSTNSDYEFLHKSNMNTYYFQKSLPRLPIPKLNKTIERYLDAQRPILTPEEFKQTEENCKKFLSRGTLPVIKFKLTYINKSLLIFQVEMNSTELSKKRTKSTNIRATFQSLGSRCT